MCYDFCINLEWVLIGIDISITQEIFNLKNNILIKCEKMYFLYFQMFFEDNIDNAKYCGHLYGLGTSFIVNGANFHESNGENANAT